MSRRFNVVAAVVVFVAGGANAVAWAQTTITRNELLGGRLLGATTKSASPIDSDSVLALSPEMRSFLKQNVNGGATDVFKLQQLIDAIMGKTSFGLEYDENTRIAGETFRLQTGNCLSFSAMFVSLARGVGLRADFQVVDIPPDWSMRKDVFVLNRHVNVSVYLGAGGTHVVDFNISDFKTTYDVEIVSDKRAFAHFFNNLGVERMQDGDTLGALSFFRSAIFDGDGDFSPPWTNLGTLYRRGGHLRHAEAAYLQALKADKRDAVAMSNLVGLYDHMGDPEKAAIYQKRVDEHRMQNPYLRFSLAREAFFDRDYDTAIEHLKHAIKQHKNDDEFYFLLGLCHLMRGDEKEAHRWTRKAEVVAKSDEKRSRYSTKIETLRAASEKVD